MKYEVKILGAGLSGLTAAITLSKAGINVKVFEKNADCGMRFHGDLQGIENWSNKEDALDSLVKMHIDLNFDYTPFRKVIFTNCRDSKNFSFNRPLFYLVKRGNDQDSIDQSLKKQAISQGVKIHFGKTILPEDADIVATGPPLKHIPAAVKGIIFHTDLPNMAVGVINEKAGHKGYSYLLVTDGYGCLCACVFSETKKIHDCFEFAQNYFVQKYNIKIKNPKSVGGVGYYSLRNIYKKGKTLYVGEAAGIQDLFAGFGMRTAMTSGYLAAQSIIKKSDYKKLAKDKFENYLKAGVVNRYIWEHVDLDNYLTILDKLNEIDNSTNLLGSMYNFNLLERIEFNIALKYIKKKYPEII